MSYKNYLFALFLTLTGTVELGAMEPNDANLYNHDDTLGQELVESDDDLDEEIAQINQNNINQITPPHIRYNQPTHQQITDYFTINHAIEFNPTPTTNLSITVPTVPAMNFGGRPSFFEPMPIQTLVVALTVVVAETDSGSGVPVQPPLKFLLLTLMGPTLATPEYTARARSISPPMPDTLRSPPASVPSATL